MFNTSRAAAPPTVADATNVHAPPNAAHTPDVDPHCVPTNTSALETASAKIEAFVRTLRYPQQRAVHVMARKRKQADPVLLTLYFDR